MQSSQFLRQVNQVKGLTDMADYVSLSDQRRMSLTVPPIIVQRPLAAILSAYDDLIENNTRRIKILEDMAQMIFREWFVNFRFPGHEKMPMVDSELGPIPEGWLSGRLGDIVTLQRGFDITKKEQEQGTYQVISSSGPGSTHAAYKVQGPGVVIGRKGTLGTVFYSERHFWPHDTTLWVKDFHGTPPLYCYYLLKHMGLEQYDCGASNPTLNRNHIHILPTVRPDQQILNNFSGIAVSLFKLKRNLEAKNANLRATRDFLLPKLISGEIPVEAAEELLA